MRDPIERRKQEIEADAFAIEIMRRIGQVPSGIEFWFYVEHDGHVAPRKFNTEAEWQKYLASLDHPVSKERLDALADVIEKASDSFARNQTDQTFWSQRVKIQAEYFRVAVPLWTTNPVAHRVEYERVDGLHESDLRPRKAGFTIPGTEQEPDFNGLFAVRRTAADGGQDRVDLLLMRMGNEVTGGTRMARSTVSSKERLRMACYSSRGVRVALMVTVSRKARATRFAVLGESAKRRKAQGSLLVYGKEKTRPRRKPTPKEFAFCRFD